MSARARFVFFYTSFVLLTNSISTTSALAPAAMRSGRLQPFTPAIIRNTQMGKITKKCFMPNKIFFIDGSTEKYMGYYECNNLNKAFEAKCIDTAYRSQVILDLENKALVLDNLSYQFKSEDDLYSSEDNEWLKDDSLGEKRSVYYTKDRWGRSEFNKELRVSEEEPNKVYFEKTDK